MKGCCTPSQDNTMTHVGGGGEGEGTENFPSEPKPPEFQSGAIGIRTGIVQLSQKPPPPSPAPQMSLNGDTILGHMFCRRGLGFGVLTLRWSVSQPSSGKASLHTT